MSRGEEEIKKSVLVTSGKVEHGSARTATPLVTHTRDTKNRRNVQSTAASKEVDMGDGTREERVELCLAQTAIHFLDTSMAQSTSDTLLPVEHICGGNNEDLYVAQGVLLAPRKTLSVEGTGKGPAMVRRRWKCALHLPQYPHLIF